MLLAMRVTIHHKKHYDWEPVPADVVLTDADKKSDNCRPAAGGGWLMKVTKTLNTHTDLAIPESAIFHTLFHADVRPLRLSRKQAAALHISKYVLPNHTHPRWMTSVEVHDDGPNEELFRSHFAPHVAEGLIDQSEVEEHVAAYLEAPPAGVEHATHLQAHLATTFKIKKAVQ